MKKENPYLNVYLGPLKEPWLNYCASLGKKPGAVFKEAAEQQLKKVGKVEKKVTVFKQSKKETDAIEESGRYEILLTSSEKKALFARADGEFCSPRRWLVDLIRRALTNEPQFSTKELEKLGESNYQLLAIGRNLNQIAKKLNEGQIAPLTVSDIGRLRKEIDKHTEIVNAAMRASVERWQIEEGDRSSKVGNNLK